METETAARSLLSLAVPGPTQQQSHNQHRLPPPSSLSIPPHHYHSHTSRHPPPPPLISSPSRSTSTLITHPPPPPTPPPTTTTTITTSTPKTATPKATLMATSNKPLPPPFLPPLTPSQPIPQTSLGHVNTPINDNNSTQFIPFKTPPVETLTPPYSPENYVTPPTVTSSCHTALTNEHCPTSSGYHAGNLNASPVISAAFTLEHNPPQQVMEVKRNIDFHRKNGWSSRVQHGRVERNNGRMMDLKRKTLSNVKNATSPRLKPTRVSYESNRITKGHIPSYQELNSPVFNRAYKKVYANATPSSYCHVCSRTKKSVRFAECALIKQGLCRKVICDKCFKTFGWDWNFAQSGNWICVHCRNLCPARAQCHIYKKINSRRGSKKAKAKMERERIEQAANNNHCSAIDKKDNMESRRVEIPHYQYQQQQQQPQPQSQYNHMQMQMQMPQQPLPRIKFEGYTNLAGPSPPSITYHTTPSMIPPISSLLRPRHMVH